MKTYPYRYNKTFAFLNFLYPITAILTLQFKLIVSRSPKKKAVLLGLPSFYYYTLMILLGLHYT